METESGPAGLPSTRLLSHAAPRLLPSPWKEKLPVVGPESLSWLFLQLWVGDRGHCSPLPKCRGGPSALLGKKGTSSSREEAVHHWYLLASSKPKSIISCIHKIQFQLSFASFETQRDMSLSDLFRATFLPQVLEHIKGDWRNESHLIHVPCVLQHRYFIGMSVMSLTPSIILISSLGGVKKNINKRQMGVQFGNWDFPEKPPNYIPRDSWDTMFRVWIKYSPCKRTISSLVFDPRSLWIRKPSQRVILDTQ